MHISYQSVHVLKTLTPGSHPFLTVYLMGFDYITEFRSFKGDIKNYFYPMQVKFILPLIFVLAIGCQDDQKTSTENINSNENSTSVENSTDSQEQIAATETSPDEFWEKLVVTEFKDKNGIVTATIPLPSSWKIMERNSNGGPTITGDHGVKVTDFPWQSFMYNYNPAIQQAYAGQQMREMPGVEQLIQQDLVPWANQQGLKFVKYYEIPEISQIDKWYSDQLYKAMPSRSEVAAFGTEWKTSDGSPYLMILHLNVSTSDAMQGWYYMCNALEAEPAHFETAKKQLIFALSNTRYNLEPIAAFNQSEAQKAGQSWAAHNQRMAQNQANFEASQRAHVNRSNAINDAIMSGWRERNAASDRNQEQFIDVINERDNVVDPNTGQKYKVAAGSNQYWMNSNGEYIGSNLQDYNPNLDKNMDQQRWQQLKKVKQ